MIQNAIRSVVEGHDLTEEEMMGVMDQVMEGQATPAQIAALLMGLRMKGETVAEITGAARVMRQKSARLSRKGNGDPVVDTCGTGGDGINTFNVSTVSAFVVAALGLQVAKHGNRAVSSLCGSADVLEYLGVPLTLTPEQVEDCLAEVGIGFLFAPVFHGAMRHAVGPRREIGIRTIFNLLGPLTNPAGADVQIIGVYDPALTETIARVLQRLGCRSAFVVCGDGGMDEISILGPTRITRLQGDAIETSTLDLNEIGFAPATLEEIRGGDAARNADIALAVLRGECGAPRNMVLLNAAAVLVAADRASTIQEGISLAAEAIDAGRALAKLDGLVAVCEAQVGRESA
jgi:anthranilate phosphoribosyltransferase